ncbi:MAG: hypothetical protein HOP17_03625 [Acidobacteria bacterium]|nr:hypothetical protein [Acidobacteriota bacterium]
MWLVIIFVESLHGIARTMILEPVVGDFPARQVSTLVGAALVVAITFIFVRWLKGSQVIDFICVGVIWVALTVIVEIVLGRMVMNLSWERIASDYDLVSGGLMPLGLLVMLLSPLTLAKMYDEV